MKVNTLLKLHEKQVDILDMIIHCDNNIQSYAKDHKIYRAKSQSWYLAKSIQHLALEIDKYKRIKERLIQYYIDIQKRITAMQPTIEITTTTEMDLLTLKS